MDEPIIVSAPARLHFGLFSIGRSQEYQFGGCGLMIDGPRTVVAARSSDRLNVVGVQSSAALAAIEHWYALNTNLLKCNFDVDSVDQLPLTLTVTETSPRHVGFGSGTQLALAVISAAVNCLGLPSLSVNDLAVSAGRAKRSAIGSHGFLQGGFLVDRGKKPGGDVAALDLRLDFPHHWPIVTVELAEATGLSGTAEKQAFEQLPESSPEDRQAMIQIVKSTIATGITNQDYSTFAEGVFSFGHRSGMMFRSLQGGAYNGDRVQKTVEIIREFGIAAVGQSSWGPGIFAIAPSEDVAKALVAHLRASLPAKTSVHLRHADNRGAVVSQARETSPG